MITNIFGIFLTAASIPVVTLLLMMYYSKNQFNNARTKLFKMTMWSLIIGSIIEIGKVFAILNTTNILILEIISRIDFSIKTIWWYTLEMYTIVSYQKETINDFKSAVKYNGFTKGLTIYYIIALLIILFIPAITIVRDINLNNIIYMPTFVLYISIFVIGIQLVLSIYYIIKTRKDKYYKDDRLVSYTVSISIILYYIIQSFFQNISFPMLFFTLFYYLAYFLNENPDLKILKETNITRLAIEKSNKTKTNFLSNISNGIKPPIDSIVNICNEVNNTPVYNDLNSKREVGEILKNGNELINIINNVLDASEYDNNEISITEIQYSLSDLLEKTVESTKQKIGSKPIRIILNVDPMISSKLYGDYTKIFESLMNILSNAAKFTEVGRITIELTSKKDDTNEHLLFAITDTGIGMKEDEKEKVFSNNTSDNDDGLGLGLVITKKFIEKMGGKIWFESSYRIGSTFYIELNQKIADKTPIGTVNFDKEEDKLNIFDCSNYRVLIVDDNLLNVKVAKRLLEKYNFKVEYLTNGDECINKIKSFEKYDMIFIDDVMSKIDGIELMHVLKSLPGYSIPPLVALTANAIVGMKEIYIKEGFDEYLAKPININEFDRVINKYFRNKTN